MARQRDPKRDQALKLFLENDGNIANRRIAEILDAPEKTISGWKSKDKWSQQLNGVLQTDERSTPKNKGSTSNKGGAPPGNQNAKGNKGNKHAAPPKGNKNAVKTGEHETIFAEFLSEDEKNLFNRETDPTIVLEEQVTLQQIRQRRMLKRLKDAEDGLSESEKQILHQLRGRKKIVDGDGRSWELNLPEFKAIEVKEKTFRKINDVLAIEDALTRVSNQLTKSIKQLSDLSMNKRKNELMDAQIKKINQEFNLPQDDKGELSIEDKVRLAREYMDGLISDE